MKSETFSLVAICSTALLTAVPAWAQTGAPPPPKTALSTGQDAKEKAEDEALVEQLEIEQQSRGEVRATGKAGSVTLKRGAGGGGGAGADMAGAGPLVMPFHVQNLMGNPAGASRALVIRTENPDPKSQTELEEDLAVMSHLLSKSLEELPGGQANLNRVMGIDVFFTPGAAPLHSLYLDNYGAVFFLTVNFPLVAPAEKRIEDKSAGDSAWEEARQELYGRRSQAGMAGEPAEEYSAEKVDKLKATVLEGLKNANNIRGLRPDEFVTVWISGGRSAGGAAIRRWSKANGPGNNGAEVFINGQTLAARRTVLTIRARKADIEAYATGKMSQADFQAKSKITTYASDRAGAPAEGLTVGGFGGRARF